MQEYKISYIQFILSVGKCELVDDITCIYPLIYTIFLYGIAFLWKCIDSLTRNLLTLTRDPPHFSLYHKTRSYLKKFI